MFFLKRDLSSVFGKYKSKHVYIDVNTHVVSSSKIDSQCIIIKVINNVFLYTGSTTFSGMFKFLKEWKLNGKKVWGSDDFKKVIGLDSYGIFNLGETNGVSLEERFELFSDQDKETFEVDNIEGYCKSFGWTNKFEIKKSYPMKNNVCFQYVCTTCKSKDKTKFVDSRFLYSTGILYQKCNYVFGNSILNPLREYSIIKCTCWDCKKITKKTVEFFRCTCGKLTCYTGMVTKEVLNGIYGSYMRKCRKCMNCVEESFDCYELN